MQLQSCLILLYVISVLIIIYVKYAPELIKLM